MQSMAGSLDTSLMEAMLPDADAEAFWFPPPDPPGRMKESAIETDHDETNNDWELFSDLALRADSGQDAQLALDLQGTPPPMSCSTKSYSSTSPSLMQFQDGEASDGLPAKRRKGGLTTVDEGFLTVLNRRSPSVPSLDELQIPNLSPEDEELIFNSDPERAQTVRATPEEMHLMHDEPPPGISPAAHTRYLKRSRKRGRPYISAKDTTIESQKIERMSGEAETDFRRRRNRAHAAISRARKDEQIDAYLQKAEGLSDQVASAKKTLKQTEALNILFMRALVKEYGDKGKELVTKVLQNAV
jgi:hypothetical protein